MINTLIINGSPKGEQSNTLKLTQAFVRGLQSTGNYEVQTVTIGKERIEHCTGCFGCWTKTPGLCVLKDDMTAWIDRYVRADLVIWSFPLYYFGMPSKTKAFLDRLLPLNLPQIIHNEDGSSAHPQRYDLSRQKQILVSTCGFFSRKNNYEALQKQFEIMNRDKTEESCVILCPEGELFSQPALKGRTDAYLETVRQAGADFGGTGVIAPETESALEELLYPVESFIEMADAGWDIHDDDTSPEKADHGRMERFVRQMAATYNTSAWKKDIVLELAFTDKNETFRLCLGKEGCTVNQDTSQGFTTRIETPYQVWRDISDGEISGPQAMMDGLYRVKGEFDMMNRMGELFITGSGNTVPSERPEKGKTNMNFLLLPWIVLWVFLPMAQLAELGGSIAVGVCAAVTLLGLKFKLTPYDRTTTAVVSLIGIAAVLGAVSPLLICLSYFIFGALWLFSCRRRIPLTAYYSSNHYGGESAYSNPLFIKTNRILTAGWGSLYLLVSITSYFLLNSRFGPYTGMINQIAPIIMGAFTIWFQQWYPAKVARG